MEYRRLNAAFQTQVRKDKDKYFQGNCKRLEELGRARRTKYFYKKSKSITEVFESKCSIVNSSSGRVCTYSAKILNR